MSADLVDEEERLSWATMLAAMMKSDSRFDGKFFTGVKTTKIYCLPSCKVRKPLERNVLFFMTREEAKEAGFRPCKKCQPEHKRCIV